MYYIVTYETNGLNNNNLQIRMFHYCFCYPLFSLCQDLILNSLFTVTKTNLAVHEDKNRVPYVKVCSTYWYASFVYFIKHPLVRMFRFHINIKRLQTTEINYDKYHSY